MMIGDNFTNFAMCVLILFFVASGSTNIVMFYIKSIQRMYALSLTSDVTIIASAGGQSNRTID